MERYSLELWDLPSGAILRTLEGHTQRVTAVAVMADGRRTLSGSDEHTLRLWDLASGGCLAQFTADATITCVAFARDDLIVAGSADGRLHILESVSQAVERPFQRCSNPSSSSVTRSDCSCCTQWPAPAIRWQPSNVQRIPCGLEAKIASLNGFGDGKPHPVRAKADSGLMYPIA
jgi:WD40 repeat protein